MIALHATTEDNAWGRASCVSGQDPDDIRQDKDGLWIQRDLFNNPEACGWEIDSHGNAVAYQMSGYPATGDAPLSEVPRFDSLAEIQGAYNL